MTRRTNQAGVNLIKRFEGLALKAYKLTGEPHYTIGYGDHGPHVKAGQVITEADAERRLRTRLREFEKAVDDAVTTDINDNRFAALVAFAYNVGIAAFRSSTLLKLVNRRRFRMAAANFGLWVGGMGVRRLPGLVRRRAAEARLFLKPPKEKNR